MDAEVIKRVEEAFKIVNYKCVVVNLIEGDFVLAYPTLSHDRSCYVFRYCDRLLKLDGVHYFLGYEYIMDAHKFKNVPCSKLVNIMYQKFKGGNNLFVCVVYEDEVVGLDVQISLYNDIASIKNQVTDDILNYANPYMLEEIFYE